jgi:hypothetical protein
MAVIPTGGLYRSIFFKNIGSVSVTNLGILGYTVVRKGLMNIMFSWLLSLLDLANISLVASTRAIGSEVEEAEEAEEAEEVEAGDFDIKSS